jgi:hypothetical protein
MILLADDITKRIGIGFGRQWALPVREKTLGINLDKVCNLVKVSGGWCTIGEAKTGVGVTFSSNPHLSYWND